MVVQARVLCVRHQHRVIKRRNGDADLGKDLGVIFHVLPDLEDAWILQHRGQHLQCLFNRHLPCGQIVRSKQIIAAMGLMDQRDIAGFARLR